MSDPIGVEAATFYHDVAAAMAQEAAELSDTMPSSAKAISELAAIALVASYQEINPHDAPDPGWCLCDACQKYLFEMRWTRTHQAHP